MIVQSGRKGKGKREKLVTVTNLWRVQGLSACKHTLHTLSTILHLLISYANHLEWMKHGQNCRNTLLRIAATAQLTLPAGAKSGWFTDSKQAGKLHSRSLCSLVVESVDETNSLQRQIWFIKNIITAIHFIHVHNHFWY